MNLFKILLRTVSFLLIIALMITLNSCKKVGHFYKDPDKVEIKKDRINIEPTEVFYKDGGLELAVCIVNGFEQDKKIRELEIYLETAKKGTEYGEPDNKKLAEAMFTDINLPVKAGERVNIPLSLDKEFVLIENASLEFIASHVKFKYDGAVIDGPEPSSEKNKMTAGIVNLSFDENGSLTGEVSIKNNFEKDVVLKKISFDVKGKYFDINPDPEADKFIEKEIIYNLKKLEISANTIIKRGQFTTHKFFVSPVDMPAEVTDVRWTRNFHAVSLDGIIIDFE